MSADDDAKVARLKSGPLQGAPGRGGAETPATGDGRGQVIQVATRCATLDEFVEKFAAFAWEGSLVLPAATALPVGTQGRFVILLRDHSVAMRGRCRVTEAKPTPVSPRNPAVKRVMMRVALLEMDETSRAVHKRLIALRSAPVPLPIPTEPSETTQIEPARHGAAPVAGSPAAAAPTPAPVSPAAPPVKTASEPRVSLNRTMIGVGIGPDGKAFLSQPAPATPRFPTPPQVETRAPGAPDTLPANPLSEFDAEDVDSFIECTLLETGELPPGAVDAAHEPLVPADGDDAPAADARRETADVRFPALVSKLPPALRGKVLRYAPYVGVAVISIVVGYAMRGSRPAPAPAGGNARTVAAAAAPLPPPAPTAREPELEVKQVEPQLEAARPAAAPPRAEPPRPSKPAAAPSPAEVAAQPAPRKAAVLETPPPASGDCTARIVTEPKDAKVVWGDAVIGRSPIDAARVPCGPAKVTIERERWQVVTVDADAQAGRTALVHERLRRPRGTLAVSSSPPGAQISINHVASGAAPAQLDVQRYEKLQIKATLKGYQPWTKSLYLKDAESKLDIQLTPRK